MPVVDLVAERHTSLAAHVDVLLSNAAKHMLVSYWSPVQHCSSSLLEDLEDDPPQLDPRRFVGLAACVSHIVQQLEVVAHPVTGLR